MKTPQRGALVLTVRRFAIASGILLGIVGGLAVAQPACQKRAGLDPRIEAVIDEFRASVPGRMGKADVAGVAIALADDQGILWTEGFGRTRGRPNTAVTPETPFLVCGMSKLITATAVMLAVQEGLVSLDEPVTTYLPEFTMNSRYEEHPERKIMLRHLLSYTAGLPVETPLGNYFEPSSTVSFEDHVKSLFGTWLVSPVGSSFYQSGVSSDLAAYVVQRVSGKPFELYLKDRLFGPLGMKSSTADRNAILKSHERAIGHIGGISKMAAVYPALGAGGVYSTARDMARLLQLHINRGVIDGRRLLEESLMDVIHSPVGIARTDPNVYYGFGVFLDRRAPERTEILHWHDGWGFGFASLIHWYPEYGLGAVVLTNEMPNSALADLGLTLTDRLIKEKIIAKRFPRAESDGSGCVRPWWGWSGHVPTPYDRAWRRYEGTHSLRFSEYSLEWWAHLAVLIVGRDEVTPRIKVHEKDGYLCVTESKFFEQVTGGFRSINERLQEVKSGVFATQGGGTLDFTREVPTWCNYRIEKR